MPSASQGYALPLPAQYPFPGNQPQQGGPYFTAGAPVSGTSCVQTVTIGGTPTGGSFTLIFGGQATGAIAWTSTDATLASNIATALNALTNVGPNGVAGAVGTGSSGIGTYTVTFQGQNANLTVPAIVVGANSMTGTSPTVSVAVTTAGVTATLRGAETGTTVVDYTTNRSYIQAGTPTAPSYVRSGYNVAEITLSGTTSTSGGGIAAWQPPEGGPVIVTRAYLDVTTASTGSANASVGVGSSATTSYTNLIPATSVHSTGVIDSITQQIAAATGGESGIVNLCQLMAAGNYVTVTGSASTAGMVATLFIEYIKP